MCIRDRRDTLDWEQVCDFDGFNSEVAKQYTIRQIPANILLSADGKILAKELTVLTSSSAPKS